VSPPGEEEINKQKLRTNFVRILGNSQMFSESKKMVSQGKGNLNMVGKPCNPQWLNLPLPHHLPSVADLEAKVACSLDPEANREYLILKLSHLSVLTHLEAAWKSNIKCPPFFHLIWNSV
jgi:hypothetical protein